MKIQPSLSFLSFALQVWIFVDLMNQSNTISHCWFHQPMKSVIISGIPRASDKPNDERALGTRMVKPLATIIILDPVLFSSFICLFALLTEVSLLLFFCTHIPFLSCCCLFSFPCSFWIFACIFCFFISSTFLLRSSAAFALAFFFSSFSFLSFSFSFFSFSFSFCSFSFCSLSRRRAWRNTSPVIHLLDGFSAWFFLFLPPDRRLHGSIIMEQSPSSISISPPGVDIVYGCL